MNCIIIDDDKLSSKVIEEFVSRTENLTLLHSFSDAVEAINALEDEEEIDLIIFGHWNAKKWAVLIFLESLTTAPQVIIVSSKEQYALNAFEYDVTDYLLKPVQYGRFYKAVSKALVRL